MKIVEVVPKNHYPQTPARTFEVVEKITAPYHVWNAHGVLGFPEYVSLCKIDMNKEPIGFAVDMNSLQTIKATVEEAKILHDAAGVGGSTLKDARKRLKRLLVANKKCNAYQIEKLQKAIPVLEKYTA